MQLGRRRSRGGRPGRGRRPRPRASSALGAEGRDPDLVRLLAQRSRRARPSGAGAGRRSRPARSPTSTAQARVDPAVDLAHVGEAAAARRRARGMLLDDREPRAGPPGAQRVGDAAQARGAARSASARSWSSCIGARTSATRLVELEARGRRRSTALEPARLALGRASLERREQLRVDVEPDHLVAAPGEVQGDPAGAAAELEDRAAAALGQLLPERQVGVVGAALDVVPDRRPRVRAHRQNSFARPRSASSLRSSSRAV